MASFRKEQLHRSTNRITVERLHTFGGSAERIQRPTRSERPTHSGTLGSLGISRRRARCPLGLGIWIGLLFLSDYWNWGTSSGQIFAWEMAFFLAIFIWPLSVRSISRQFRFSFVPERIKACKLPAGDPRRHPLEVRLNWYAAATAGWMVSLLLGFVFSWLILSTL